VVNFLMNIKKYPGTKNILWQAIANMPDQTIWLSWNNQLGDLLRSEQRWDDAISTYESILEHNAVYWQAYIGLGLAKYERGDGLQAAINEFKKAIMIPNSREEGYSAIGFVLLRDGRYADADNWFVQALVINPDCRWFYAVQRDIATEVGDLSPALTIYQEAILRFPDFAHSYYAVARIYQLKRQPLNAIGAIERALVLMKPPNADYYIRAGSIYEWSGDKNKALHAYYQALLIDPQNAAALEGIVRLGR